MKKSVVLLIPACVAVIFVLRAQTPSESAMNARLDSLRGNGSPELAEALGEAASFYEKAGNYRQAVAYLSEAREIYRSQQRHAKQAECLLSMARNNCSRQYYGTAIRQLTEAKNITDSISDGALALRVLESRWRLHEAISDYGSAFRYYRLWDQLHDSLNRRPPLTVAAVSTTQSPAPAPSIQTNDPDEDTFHVWKVCTYVFAGLFLAASVAFIAAVRRRKSGLRISPPAPPAEDIVLDTLIAAAGELSRTASEMYRHDRRKDAPRIDAGRSASLSQYLFCILYSLRHGAGGEPDGEADLDAAVKSARELSGAVCEKHGIELVYKSTGPRPVACNQKSLTVLTELVTVYAVSESGPGKVEEWIETIGKKFTFALEYVPSDGEVPIESGVLFKQAELLALSCGLRVFMASGDNGNKRIGFTGVEKN